MRNKKVRIKEKTSPVLWLWGFCGDSHRCGSEMGIGIGIHSQAVVRSTNITDKGLLKHV